MSFRTIDLYLQIILNDFAYFFPFARQISFSQIAHFLQYMKKDQQCRGFALLDDCGQLVSYHDYTSQLKGTEDQ